MKLGAGQQVDRRQVRLKPHRIGPRTIMTSGPAGLTSAPVWDFLHGRTRVKQHCYIYMVVVILRSSL